MGPDAGLMRHRVKQQALELKVKSQKPRDKKARNGNSKENPWLWEGEGDIDEILSIGETSR